MRILLLCLTLALAASPLSAQDTLGLSAPDTVRDSGLLKHLLPRFSLKTGIRVSDDPAGEMVLAPKPPGVPVFQGGDVVYHLRIQDTKRQNRFRDWLTSDIGKRTVDSFQPGGKQPFSASVDTVKTVVAPAFEGNVALGADLSLRHCGRCHVVGTQNQMSGIGSTPSFGVLRSLPDWDDRFQQFFVLRPHGAFTQIEDVTEPFPLDRPSPIVPVRITLDDLDAILAYVSAIAAADLGAPLQTQ